MSKNKINKIPKEIWKLKNLEDITCRVYTIDGSSTDIGSVLGYSWFNFQNIVTYERRKRRGIKNPRKRTKDNNILNYKKNKSLVIVNKES